MTKILNEQMIKNFSDNLNALQRRYPTLVQKLKQLDMNEVVDEYTIVPAKKTGQPYIEIDGNNIYNRYDPQGKIIERISSELNPYAKLGVILGYGLGYHLFGLHKSLEKNRNSMQAFFVIEHDLKLFALSLLIFNFSSLFQTSTLYLFIGQTPYEFEVNLSRVLENPLNVILKDFVKAIQYFYNDKYFKLNPEYYKTCLKIIKERFTQVLQNFGNDPDDSIIGLENIIANLKTIIDNPGIKEIKGKLKGIPGILVSTGPTLDKNVDELKGLENKAFIIAADSALKVLLKHGIKPHMVSTLERIMLTVPYFEDIPEEDKKDIWNAACPVVRPELYETYNGPTVNVFRDFAHFHWLQNAGIEKGTLRTGASCSNMAFKILDYLGCDPIIIIGQDLSIQRDGKTHAQDAEHAVELGKTHILPKKDFFEIKGNYEDTVLTTPIFFQFLKTFITDIDSYKGKCINATAGGAFIDGTEVMSITDAKQEYITKEFNIIEILRSNLTVPDDEEREKQYNVIFDLLEETEKMIQTTINKCTYIAEKIKKIEKKINSFDDKEKSRKYLEEQYKSITKKVGEITKPKLFYHVLMHIIQSYYIKTIYDNYGLFFQYQDSLNSFLGAFKNIYKLVLVIKKIAKMTQKRINDSIEKFEKTKTEESL